MFVHSLGQFMSMRWLRPWHGSSLSFSDRMLTATVGVCVCVFARSRPYYVSLCCVFCVCVLIPFYCTCSMPVPLTVTLSVHSFLRSPFIAAHFPGIHSLAHSPSARRVGNVRRFFFSLSPHSVLSDGRQSQPLWSFFFY